MNDANGDDEDFESPSVDDGTPLPSLGKVRMSPGADKFRKRLSGLDAMRIRKAKEIDAETMLDRLSRQDEKGRLRYAAPSDPGLVMIFAHLHVAGASAGERGRVAAVIRKNWPQLSANDIKAAQNLAECEVDAARRSAGRKNEEPNVTDLNGFDELCAYGLKGLAQSNTKLGQSPVIFHHGTEIVRVPVTPNGESRIDILTQKTFNHVLNTQAPFRKTMGDDGYISVSAPHDVAEHLFAAPTLPVPVLKKIVTVPTFTKDGKLIQFAGYNKDSGLLYLPAPGLEIPIPPRGDLTAAAKASAAYLVDLFADFPFDGNRRAANLAAPAKSMVNYMGLLITPIVAPIFDDVIPAHLLTKPAPGTGATLLAEACQIVTDGRSELRPPLSKNEDERRKALFTMLQSPRNFSIFDNIAGGIDSNTFASFLTSKDWTDRVLGRTGERTVRNSTAVILTGNNPGFSSELIRRLSLIKLDAKEADPALRSDFKTTDFKGHLHKHRGEIIGHILVLVQHWVNKGMPQATGKALESFKPWFWTVGGVLEAAGFTGFQANRDELDLVTSETDNPMQALVAAWYAAAQVKGGEFSMSATTGGDAGLIKLAQENEIALPIRLKRHAEDDFDFSPEHFGRYLGTAKDTTFEIEHNGAKVAVSLVHDGRRNGSTWWKLEDRKSNVVPLSRMERSRALRQAS